MAVLGIHICGQLKQRPSPSASGVKTVSVIHRSILLGESMGRPIHGVFFSGEPFFGMALKGNQTKNHAGGLLKVGTPEGCFMPSWRLEQMAFDIKLFAQPATSKSPTSVVAASDFGRIPLASSFEQAH